MSRITVTTSDLEVEKPSGGGKGHNFKQPGQMAELVNILKARGADVGAGDPLPTGMSRKQCVGVLRAARQAVLDAEAAKESATKTGKEKPVCRFPIDAVIDYIETSGFPAA
jgi:hypothetical protein